MTRLSVPEESTESSTVYPNTNAIRDQNVVNHPKQWLLDVRNSTLWMTLWCLDVQKPGFSACLLSSSDLTIEGSEILSNMECSPFIVTGDVDGHGCQIQIIRSIHKSTSNLVLPLVGTSQNTHQIDVGLQMMNDRNTNNESHQRSTICGVGLFMKNSHFVVGTGPLFWFDSDYVLSRGMSVETSLLKSTLMNISSSHDFSPGKQMFGSEVSQLVVGSCLESCTNHDSGTGMMSLNMGGSLTCLNTSFSSCIRERNTPLDFSFENITQTHIGRFVLNSTSTVTSVTFTLCTFNNMTVAAGVNSGGSAIFLHNSSSSLAIRTCFFHNCSCAGDDNDGGAVCFKCSLSKMLPFSVSGSSFTDCSTFTSVGGAETVMDCGGSILAFYASSISIDRCYFENSKAEFDGAMFLSSAVVSLSNSSFIDCSANERGAVSIDRVKTVSLSFLQFRECSSINAPDGKDVFFYNNRSSHITPDMIKYCDSTSGSPNVFFNFDLQSDSDLVPQVNRIASISSVDVTFDKDNDEATVTVLTRTAIKGTMRVLLEGSNVPRLVHVEFGNDTDASKIGTVIVSSGGNGILPEADYVLGTAAILGFKIATPLLDRAESSLKDWNTTEIVVSGVRLEKGSYWMLVEKEGKEVNITLTHSNSTTLKGTAPLHPSNAEGRLEWSTEYEVTRVMWQHEDGLTEEEMSLAFMVSFTTPDEPARIEACSSRQLSKERMRIKLFLDGRALMSRNGKVNLTDGTKRWESLSDVDVLDNTHCTAEFAVGEEETATEMKYGGKYTLEGYRNESSGFHVEDGIRIVVPFPPKVTQMEFIFSNTLNTGCLVVLIGSNMVVGNSMNVTLNISLSFIASITSDTKAESSELRVGWSETLKHNTNYKITSIEAMKEDDGKILFDPVISNTTGSLPSEIVISVDSGSSSDWSLFCGDRVRPCCSIEDGWKIVDGIGISSLSISIVHKTTQKEQVKMLSQHEVVISSGPSTKPELFVSPSLSSSSSELEGVGMVDVCGGRLWIRDVDFVLSDSPSLIFIRMVEGHLTIETCSFTGSKGTQASNIIESSAALCEWDTGVLYLFDSTTVITSTRMCPLSHGTISMKGGNLTVETSTYHHNTPHSSSFPSLRHNIRCSEGGEIEIGSLSGGDGVETPSAWISASDCSLVAKDEISRSPFFVPTLSSSSSSKLNKTEKAFHLTIEGTLLIPCSLKLEVFVMTKEGKEGISSQHPLTEDTTTLFNESTIELFLPLSFFSSFDDSLEWRGRLAFGNDQITDTSFVIQESARDRRSQAMVENMKWWLPLVISLSVLFVIVVVVVLVCWRRRRVQKKGTNVEEMKDSTQPPIEEEKMEIVTDNRIGVISIQTRASSEQKAETKQKYEPEPSDDLINFENVEEALQCCGDMTRTVYVSKDRTLFNALHSENKWDFRVRQAQRQLVEGLKGVWKKDREAAILRTLTAHNILLDSKENVCLRLNLDVSLPAPLPIFTQQPQPDEQHPQQDQPDAEPAVEMNESKQMLPQLAEEVSEGVRWYAPEVISNKAHVNSLHGAVFSLGLLLWEMETGCVPFGEQDAVNASRQIVAGVTPKLELVENTEMRELISQCLSLEPDDRPDLDTIETTLALHPADTSIHPKALVQS